MIKEKERFIKNKYVISITMLLLVFGITICFATNQLDTGEVVKNVESVGINQIENAEKTIKETDTQLITVANPLANLKVTANYGKRVHPVTKAEISHDGVDFAAAEGDKVMAVIDGVIEETGFDMQAGNFIIIKHENAGDVSYTQYAHLSKIEVEPEDAVETGTVIGKAGKTGMATGPHLHFQVMNAEKESIDPSILLEY